MRLDAHLVANGAARSRERAREAVAAGLVCINGEVARKASKTVAPDDEVTCEGETHPWVSRGALKLEAGLRAFALDPAGLACLDLGASTGGFTEVLLHRGAARVYAVDVGHGQLADTVAADPRVVNLERTHARDLSRALVPDPIGLLVCDVSFISLKKALPPALALCADRASLCVLVKPQFELGRSHIGKGGLVRYPGSLDRWVTDEIAPWFEDQGWRPHGVRRSPIEGGDGNTEFLLAASRG